MIEFIKEFEGIIGTILGVVTTLIVTHLLKNTGHINIEMVSQNLKLFKRDEIGGMEQVELLSDAEYADFDIDIEIKNKSESRKSIKNIIIKLQDQDKKVVKQIISKDTDTERFAAASYHYNELTYLNCEGKDLLKKNLKVFITPEELENAKYLVLEYLQVDKQLFSQKQEKVEIKK